MAIVIFWQIYLTVLINTNGIRIFGISGLAGWIKNGSAFSGFLGLSGWIET
jgi:hypothetical protein